LPGNGKLNLRAERDPHFAPAKTLSTYAAEAHAIGAIRHEENAP
jgi:hypothetical protein